MTSIKENILFMLVYQVSKQNYTMQLYRLSYRRSNIFTIKTRHHRNISYSSILNHNSLDILFIHSTLYSANEWPSIIYDTKYTHLKFGVYIWSKKNFKVCIVRIIYFNYLFFLVIPLTSCFLSCRPFVANAKFSTVLGFLNPNFQLQNYFFYRRRSLWESKCMH